jgi:O-acetylserine/cysteine efflux transporter
MTPGWRGATGRRGAVAALIAAGTAWGTSIPFSKAALGWLAPGWLTVARFGLAAAILLIICARSGRLRGCFTLPVLASGALGYGGAASLQNLGLARTSVTHASLIIGALPVLVAVIAALWHRTVARPMAWAGFALSLGGVGLVAGGPGHGSTLAGDLLMFASAVLVACATVAQGRFLEGRDPIALTAVQFLGTALSGLPFAATEALPSAHPGLGPLLATAGVVTVGTLVPYSLFALGQKRVSAEVAGAFLNLEPLVGAMIGVVVFGDPAGLRQLGGGLAIGAGIALSSLPLLAASKPVRLSSLPEPPVALSPKTRLAEACRPDTAVA